MADETTDTATQAAADEKPAALPVKKPAQPAGRAVPKWEAEVRERVKKGIQRYSKPMADMVARDANEGDTRLLVTDFLCDALGYDKYADLTTEYLVRGEFADYGVRIDKQLVAFIEVKRATTKLDEKHLRQVETYAVNEGVEWVILTNGQQWKVYHITGALPMIVDLAFDVSLLDTATTAQRKVDLLYYLTKESFKRREIDEVWKARRATSPKAIAAVLLSPIVLAVAQKELRKQTQHRAEEDELRALVKGVLRPECFEK